MYQLVWDYPPSLIIYLMLVGLFLSIHYYKGFKRYILPSKIAFCVTLIWNFKPFMEKAGINFIEAIPTYFVCGMLASCVIVTIAMFADLQPKDPK